MANASTNCRLIYRSESLWENLSNEMLEELGTKSATANTALGISGLLILSNTTFLQVLEGPSMELNMLFKKISNDPRHENVQLIEYQQINELLFANWAMNILDLFNLPKDIRNLLVSKYKETDGFIDIPWRGDLATSLLLDAKVLLEKSSTVGA